MTIRLLPQILYSNAIQSSNDFVQNQHKNKKKNPIKSTYRVFRDSDNKIILRGNFSIETFCISLQRNLSDIVTEIKVLKTQKEYIKTGLFSAVEVTIPLRLDIKTQNSGSYTILHTNEEDYK